MVNIECIFFFLTIRTKWYEMDILLQEYNSEVRNFTEARHCCGGLVVLKCESTTGPHKGSLAHWKGLLLISLAYNKRRSRLDLQICLTVFSVL